MAEDDEDALYSLPLEEFVPARDARARELRREKRRDEAAAVAALAKPSRPAWMVNQLSRGEGSLMAKLLECAEALAEAQDAAVAGEGARDLRAASRAERQAVDKLMTAARDLRPEGHAPSAAILERVRTTLQSAAGDEALRERIRAGRLVEEPAAGGAWPMMDLPADSGTATARTKERAAPKPRRDERAARRGRKADAKGEAAARPKRTSARQRQEPAEEHERAAEEQAAEAAKAAKADEEKEQAARRRELRDELTAARKHARGADRDRERAQRDADRAAERLERLVAEAESARAAADAAASKLERAETAANAADEEVSRIEAEIRGA